MLNRVASKVVCFINSSLYCPSSQMNYFLSSIPVFIVTALPNLLTVRALALSLLACSTRFTILSLLSCSFQCKNESLSFIPYAGKLCNELPFVFPSSRCNFYTLEREVSRHFQNPNELCEVALAYIFLINAESSLKRQWKNIYITFKQIFFFSWSRPFVVRIHTFLAVCLSVCISLSWA